MNSPTLQRGGAGSHAHAALRWYFASAMAFMLPGSIQSVLYPFLIAVLLHASPDRVGFAQMAGQLPSLLLILVGGLIADRFDQRRILILIHALAALPPLCLAIAIHSGALSYALLVSFAVLSGTFGAFAQPARDAMLNRVATGDLQRTVTVSIGLNFAIQIVGYALASLADRVGVVPLMLLQSLIIALGALAIARIPPHRPAPSPNRRHPLVEIGEGIVLVFKSPTMRPAMLMSCGMGMFFASTFVVLLPLIVRDVYHGTAQSIAMVFAALMFGTLGTIFWMMRRGGIQRQGKALMLSTGIGCLILALLTLRLPFYGFLLVVLVWGLGAGVNSTMGRTIMQEAAPESHRARILSVFSLANIGAMPIGSVIMGYSVKLLGPLHAAWVPVIGMAIVISAVHLTSTLWQQRAAPPQSVVG